MSDAAKIRWRDLYSEAELYRAAVKLYTKPLFQWRKALSTSWDERTLYDFARQGIQRLEAIHRKLAAERFRFRPGAARTFSFNGKRRTLYIFPWEERVVDLLLYRLLNARFQPLFSASSYAYRARSHGVDLCQTRIATLIRTLPKPLFVFKRDIASYFDSIHQDVLLAQLAEWIEPDDYLMRLLAQRVRFAYGEADRVLHAEQGIPFGTPIACFFANLYLMDLDSALDAVAGLRYFRYADDLLGISADSGTVCHAAGLCDAKLADLGLTGKASHSAAYALSERPASAHGFVWVSRFKHLGLEFRASGCTGLSRDKARKLRNLFRFAFRRKAGRFRRTEDPRKRAALAIQIARGVIEDGVRHVAIVDYYLRHVRDEKQLQELDRWLAEEVLALAFRNGHKKGSFRRMSFAQLRADGLPSLVHRGRLIRHRQIQSSFFRWKEHQNSKGTRGGWRQARKAFSLDLKAAAHENLVGERGGL